MSSRSPADPAAAAATHDGMHAQGASPRSAGADAGAAGHDSADKPVPPPPLPPRRTPPSSPLPVKQMADLSLARAGSAASNGASPLAAAPATAASAPAAQRQPSQSSQLAPALDALRFDDSASLHEALALTVPGLAATSACCEPAAGPMPPQAQAPAQGHPQYQPLAQGHPMQQYRPQMWQPYPGRPPLQIRPQYPPGQYPQHPYMYAHPQNGMPMAPMQRPMYWRPPPGYVPQQRPPQNGYPMGRPVLTPEQHQQHQQMMQQMYGQRPPPFLMHPHARPFAPFPYPAPNQPAHAAVSSNSSSPSQSPIFGPTSAAAAVSAAAAAAVGRASTTNLGNLRASSSTTSLNALSDQTADAASVRTGSPARMLMVERRASMDDASLSGSEARPPASMRRRKQSFITEDGVEVVQDADSDTDEQQLAQTIDSLREQLKKSSDPRLQFELAKVLIGAGDSYLDEGFALLKKSSSSGFSEAQCFLAQAYYDDDQFEAAYAQWLAAAKRTYPPACYHVGKCCEEAKGTKRNIRLAHQMYTKAATAGHKPSMYRLGMADLKGELGQRADVKAAVKWFKRGSAGADKENPHCLVELADIYEKGVPPVIMPDPRYALSLLIEASSLDFPPAQYRLGYCYEYGELGCEANGAESIRLYTLSARTGYADAQLSLAGWYMTGASGILPKDERKAFELTSFAAEQNLARAQFTLGYFHENGIGIAAGNGEERAIKRLKELRPDQQIQSQPTATKKKGFKAFFSRS
ncbi:hypothetical protein BC831DRAFT_440091 [Entophlyctis helioformis]|nr:hypothetical protein BC831DRAFT_440091 [Entophlyctis helioformis]